MKRALNIKSKNGVAQLSATPLVNGDVSVVELRLQWGVETNAKVAFDKFRPLLEQFAGQFHEVVRDLA